MGTTSLLRPEQVQQAAVAGLSQPEPALGVDVRGVHVVVAAETRLGRDEVEPGEDVDGEDQRLGDAGHLAAQPAQDAPHLAVLLALEHGPLGAEVGDARPAR